MPFKIVDAATQADSLVLLAEQARSGLTDPRVVKVARQITAKVPARDFMGELRAIYHAVKVGDPRVKPLQFGLRYVADPVVADYFSAPGALLDECEDGACSGDCDEAAALTSALAGAIGFRTGVRAYGRSADQDAEYDHVYAIVAGPDKNAPEKWIGMDTTVEEAEVGWEPPPGHVLSAEITTQDRSFNLFTAY